MDTCGRIFTLMTPSLGRITTSTYLLSDLQQGYFGTPIGHHLQSMPWQGPSYNCVHIHLWLLSLISRVWVPNRRKGYTSTLEKSSNCGELVPLYFCSWGIGLQPHRDISYEAFREEYWVYHLPFQTLVIATVCQYQVLASHSYANFHSIDHLRQVLLD
jgi:hypothetical protein